jgi:hypothetical protein
MPREEREQAADREVRDGEDDDAYAHRRLCHVSTSSSESKEVGRTQKQNLGASGSGDDMAAQNVRTAKTER